MRVKMGPKDMACEEGRQPSGTCLGPPIQELVDGFGSVEGLTAFELKRAADGMQFLAEEGIAVSADRRLVLAHPLARHFINQAPWTRKWLAWCAEALRACRHAEGVASLTERLRDSARCGEALSVLRVADRMRRAGFLVSFDELVSEHDSRRPDLAIREGSSEDPVHVEVTTLGESNSSREAGATSWAITSELLVRSHALDYCGRIHRTLSPGHCAEIARRVGAAGDIAARDGIFQSIEIPHVLELGIAPHQERAVLALWAEDRGIPLNAVSGPSYNSDETGRVRRAIEREQRQLPRSRINFLVVEDAALFYSSERAVAAAATIAEELHKYPHVIGAVVSGTHGGSAEPRNHMLPPHAYFCHCSHEFLIEHHLVLLNRFCSLPLPASLVARLYTVFAQPLA